MYDSQKLLAVFLFLTVLGLIVGCLISSPLMDRLYEGGFTKWKLLGKPPEPIDTILGSEFGERGIIMVRVKSMAGKEYRCCEKNSEWQSVEPSEYVYNQPCFDLPSLAPEPSNKVLQCTEVAAYEYSTERTQFVLLNDGNIWMWHQSASLGYYIYIVCGSTIIGSFVGGIVAWLIWTRQGKIIPIETVSSHG